MVQPTLHEESQTLAAEVSAVLGDTPLVAVEKGLLGALDWARQAVEAGASEACLAGMVAHVRRVLGELPTSFEDRFHLDANIIASILREWSTSGEIAFNPFVVPRYMNDWAYYRLPMPSEDRHARHVIGVTGFVGADKLEDVDFGDYVWLVHELIHHVLYAVQDRFVNTVVTGLRQRLRVLRLRSSADAGAARKRALDCVDELAAYWTPRGSQVDWSHEVAVDVAAFHILGSAYAARLRALLGQRRVDPDKLTNQHPSYRIRCQAVALTAEQLGWAVEAWGLQEAMRAREPAGGASSLYGDPEILQVVIDAVLEICHTLKLPAMTPDRIEAIGRRSLAEEPSKIIELISRACILKHTLAPGDYDAWHRDALRQLT